jgi:hypothetical protein
MPANSHFDRTLTDYAVGYMRGAAGFVANLACPPVKVDRQSDRYQIFNRNDFSRDEFKPRAPGTPAQILDARMSSDTYYCEVYAGKTQIIHRERDNSDDPAGYEQAKTALVTGGAMVKRERLFVARAHLNTSWASTNRMVGTSASAANLDFIQFNQSGNDPVATLLRAHTLVRRGTNGRKANVLSVSPNVHDSFLTNTAILERIKYSGGPSNPALITASMLASVFDVEKYLVPYSVYASNAEGVTAAYADVASGDMVLMYQAPGKFEPTAIRQFCWSQYDAASSPERVAVRKWTDEDIESDWVETQLAPDFKVVADSAGVHFASCLG